MPASLWQESGRYDSIGKELVQRFSLIRGDRINRTAAKVSTLRRALGKLAHSDQNHIQFAIKPHSPAPFFT